MVKSYRELVAWQKAIELVERIYTIAKTFPREEQYRLVDQLTRAVVSVPSNIAEGFGRSTPKDFVHFLVQARGSLYEVETQLIIAQKLGFVADVSIELSKMSELGKIINGLMNKLTPDT